MPNYVVLLGAPGAGKGTQAKLIAEKLSLQHVSSGDIFRTNIKNETDLGKEVKAILDAGDLVPDDITIAMIKDRLAEDDCENGAILDGFPRTPAQAEALDTMLSSFSGKVDVVPYIKVADEELIARLTGRWTCRECGHIYHIRFNPPKEAGLCDHDGSELYQRADDKEETVTNRIQVYMEQTSPLIDHYAAAGVLEPIDGAQEIDLVTADLLAVLPKANA